MADSEKLVSLDTLAKITASLKNEKKKVILCHGTFDLLHIGHIKHLKTAKKHGDILLVTVTADEYVNKGPDRPVFNHYLRAENLSALECVNYVAINHTETSVNVLEKLRPDVYVKGDEYKEEQNDITGNIALERNAIGKYGGYIEYTQELTFSSSKLLNKYFEAFTPETKKFIDTFKLEFDIETVYKQLDRLKKLNVAVIGDGIIDEYHYVDVLGQTGKSNIQAVRYEQKERFAGGSFAVANHVAGFVNRVTLVTGIGDNKKDADFVKSKLKDNVEALLFRFSQAPTLTKLRYVNEEMDKFFEVYFSDTNPMDDILEKEIIQWLDRQLLKFDVVIVPDFGNGFITPKIVETISKKSKFLAVNTQINGGNRGYHVISRYPKADYISLNEPEIRMACHDKNNELTEVAKKTATLLNAKYTAVTRGVKGVMLLDRENNETFNLPAISTKVVDKIGAGDAFLSLSALCLANDIKPELSAFLGSVAAALDVQIVCNRDFIDPIAVKKYVTTLFK